MSWLLVAGDFTPLGGMDAANHALARHLASRDEVHLVTHRAWPDLAALPNVTVHRVWRPFNRHLLGSPLLSRTGQRGLAAPARVGRAGDRQRRQLPDCGRQLGPLPACGQPCASSAGSLARRDEDGVDLPPRPGGGAHGAPRSARRHLQQPPDARRCRRADRRRSVACTRHLLRRRPGPLFAGERGGARGGQGGAVAAGRPAACRFRRRARRSPEGVRHGVQRLVPSCAAAGTGTPI